MKSLQSRARGTKPGEWGPGAKERGARRTGEGSAHQILLKVKSEETGELTTGLGSRKIMVTWTKGCLHMAFGEKGRGSGDSEVSERTPKETAEGPGGGGHRKPGMLSGQPVGSARAHLPSTVPWQDLELKPLVYLTFVPPSPKNGEESVL